MQYIVYSHDAAHNARYASDNFNAARRDTWPTDPTMATRFKTKAHAKQCVGILARYHGINASIEPYKASFHGRTA